jgi:hypothetical protein
MAAKLTRLTHKIAIKLHLVAESCTILSSRSRRPVRKLLDTPSYAQSCTVFIFSCLKFRELRALCIASVRGAQWDIVFVRLQPFRGLSLNSVLDDGRPAGALCLGVKRPESEADHFPPSSGGLRTRGAIRPLPHTSSWRATLPTGQI